MQLKNATGEISRIGYCVKHAVNDPNSFIYSNPGDSNIMGIITQAVPKYALCEIATSGTAKVFCFESVVQGSTIRAAKAGDNISRGTCKVAKPTDTPYLKIGTALESGKGLINCAINIAYSGGGVSIANGTYTIGLGLMTDGTVTIVNGVITAIQEAT